jgi:hypothetical protein
MGDERPDHSRCENSSQPLDGSHVPFEDDYALGMLDHFDRNVFPDRPNFS